MRPSSCREAERVINRDDAAGNTTGYSRYEYATIYAQWGNNLKALEWLDTAMRLRDPGLENLKTDQLMYPLAQRAALPGSDAS